MSEVMGYWVKGKHRCDYCHHAREAAYVVRDGDTRGTFCGRLHYELASDAMTQGKLPEHEKKEQE